MFNDKTHDIMRKLQLIFAAAAGALGILANAGDLGRVGIIVIAALAAAGYFVGQLAENDSRMYFQDKEIIEKTEEQ